MLFQWITFGMWGCCNKNQKYRMSNIRFSRLSTRYIRGIEAMAPTHSEIWRGSLIGSPLRLSLVSGRGGSSNQVQSQNELQIWNQSPVNNQRVQIQPIELSVNMMEQGVTPAALERHLWVEAARQRRLEKWWMREMERRHQWSRDFRLSSIRENHSETGRGRSPPALPAVPVVLPIHNERRDVAGSVTMSTKPTVVDAEIGGNVRNSAFHSVHPDDAASNTFRSVSGSPPRSPSSLGGSSSAGTGTLFRKVKKMKRIEKSKRWQLRRQDTNPMTYQTGKNRLDSLRRNQSPRNLDTVSELV